MISRFFLLAALAGPLFPAEPVTELARSVREAGLDAEECYQVRELTFTREDLKFYFTEGVLIFSKPAGGRRFAAVFSAEVEGGDGEVIVLPPSRAERQSMGTFTGSPNLDEHIRGALLVFTDRGAEELLARARESGRKSAERGLLLAEQYSPVLRNISDSFQTRLVQDILNPDNPSPLFFAAASGVKLGNFDLFYDPDSREQIQVGQLTTRDNAPRYDIWTSFESRSIRKGVLQPPKPSFAISDYRIEAVLDDQLHLSAVTRLKITPARRMRAFAFQLSNRMQVKRAALEGKPAETFVRESMRATALSPSSGFFLLVAPETLEPGRAYEVEFQHEGDVVFNAGNGVYVVGDRSTWYPHRGAEFTSYDLRFRYPKRLSLVSTGELVEERVEGDTRITHRRTSGPVRFAGFNLGAYDHVSMKSGGYTIEVYGNKTNEPGLEPRRAPVIPDATGPARRHNPELVISDLAPPPGTRLMPLAQEVTGAFEFMQRQFGPPPLKSLTVSPIPGAFGQGFPGLVYLSTISYLPAENRPPSEREKSRQTFFSDLLAPHEVAHQWWGNLVGAEAYQDAWLMEALANYSALLYLEKRKGARALDMVLEQYRTRLLSKRSDGGTVESLGPITWGPRVETTDPAAARTIVYEKGTWILHMLRQRMGDERFLKMLGELGRRYRYHTVSTNSFRALAEEFMPEGAKSLEPFFENWVHGTGIPALKVSSAVRGKAPAFRATATVTQTEVDEDFSVEVPVEFQLGGGAPVVKWVRTSTSEPVSVTVPLKRAPVKVGVPATGVLSRR